MPDSLRLPPLRPTRRLSIGPSPHLLNLPRRPRSPTIRDPSIRHHTPLWRRRKQEAILLVRVQGGRVELFLRRNVVLFAYDCALAFRVNVVRVGDGRDLGEAVDEVALLVVCTRSSRQLHIFPAKSIVHARAIDNGSTGSLRVSYNPPSCKTVP